jgi:hypothetical protein
MSKKGVWRRMETFQSFGNRIPRGRDRRSGRITPIKKKIHLPLNGRKSKAEQR